MLLAALKEEPKPLLLRGGLPAGVVEKFVRCEGGGPAGVVDGACEMEPLPLRFGVAGEFAPKLKLKDIAPVVVWWRSPRCDYLKYAMDVKFAGAQLDAKRSVRELNLEVNVNVASTPPARLGATMGGRYSIVADMCSFLSLSSSAAVSSCFISMPLYYRTDAPVGASRHYMM